MTEIKFDIKIRHIETGNTFREIMTLDEIMTSGKLYTKGIQEVVFKRQFTGFKNKKGVDLYQGCIIHYTKHKGYLLESFIGEVIWMEEGCWGYRTSGYDYAFNSADEIQFDILDHIEVIGNIYESPELLS